MEKMLEIISEILELDLTEQDLSRNLNTISEWDSIAGLGLMVKADQEFDVTITPEQLENSVTLSDLVKLLEGRS